MEVKIMKPLNSLLEEIEQEENTIVQTLFEVNNLETATEASRRIAYFEEKKAEINTIIEKQISPFLLKIEKIKEWGEQAKVEFIEKQAHYSNHLEMYLRQEVAKQLESGKKPKKTLALPYGKIALKAQQPKFEKNETELFQYARENGFVRVKEETAWNELKKACVVAGGKMYDTNGEIIPGVTVIEQPEKFELKMD
jgi:hypothetical protein